MDNDVGVCRYRVAGRAFRVDGGNLKKTNFIPGNRRKDVPEQGLTVPAIGFRNGTAITSKAIEGPSINEIGREPGIGDQLIRHNIGGRTDPERQGKSIDLLAALIAHLYSPLCDEGINQLGQGDTA